jgi:thiosulfate sulfurtransferase
MDSFLKNKNKHDHLIVYCYHGILSRDAAEFFMNQGFKNVYSLNGGFSEYAQTQTEL